MTIRRAALYIGGASLLVAWLSSAASMSLQPGPTAAAPAVPEDRSVDVATARVLVILCIAAGWTLISIPRAAKP